MSVRDVCLKLHPLPLVARRKEKRASVMGVQMAEVAAAEEEATPVIPAAAVMRRS